MEPLTNTGKFGRYGGARFGDEDGTTDVWLFSGEREACGRVETALRKQCPGVRLRTERMHDGFAVFMRCRLPLGPDEKRVQDDAKLMREFLEAEAGA